MWIMKNSGTWCCALFLVTLHWYEKIKENMWLKLIGLLPTQYLCFIAKCS
jgi:ketopantoate reductase